MGSDVNLVQPFLHIGSLDITFTVPLNQWFIQTVNNYFQRVGGKNKKIVLPKFSYSDKQILCSVQACFKFWGKKIQFRFPLCFRLEEQGQLLVLFLRPSFLHQTSPLYLSCGPCILHLQVQSFIYTHWLTILQDQSFFILSLVMTILQVKSLYTLIGSILYILFG